MLEGVVVCDIVVCRYINVYFVGISLFYEKKL